MIYYIANWKMFQTAASIKKFVQAYKKNQGFQTQQDATWIGIAPSYEHLNFLQQKLKTTPLVIGAQDCSHFVGGAHTGQVSVLSLRESGVQFCLVGHSEVRQFLHQSDEQIALKFKLLLAANISPVLCIGQTLQQKDDGLTLQVLYDQLEPILSFLQSYQGSVKIFISYEPIYAIGTGVIPTEQELHDVFYFLRNLASQLPVAKNILFLYGGSVSSATIEQLHGISGIDGFLIGKSSVDFQELKKIVESK